MPRWCPKEDAILAAGYPDESIPLGLLLRKLPGRTESALFQRAHYLGIGRPKSSERLSAARKKLAVDARFFSVPSLENCYWAGFIAGDGCVRLGKNVVSLKLASKDREHLAKFSQACGYTGEIREEISRVDHLPGVVNKKPRMAVRVTIAGVPQWVRDLRENFCVVPRKSLILQPPNLTDPLLVEAYLVGLIDSDGSIRKESTQLAFYGTRPLLEWVRAYVGPKTRSEAKVFTKRRHLCRYEPTGGKNQEFWKHLKGLSIPKLSRKWDRV